MRNLIFLCLLFFTTATFVLSSEDTRPIQPPSVTMEDMVVGDTFHHCAPFENPKESGVSCFLRELQCVSVHDYGNDWGLFVEAQELKDVEPDFIQMFSDSRHGLGRIAGFRVEPTVGHVYFNKFETEEFCLHGIAKFNPKGDLT